MEGWHRYGYEDLAESEEHDLIVCLYCPQIIGRRPIMLSALSLFSLGSTICGAASSMNMLIAGRGSSCSSQTVMHLFQSHMSDSCPRAGSRGNHFVGADHVIRPCNPSRTWHIQRAYGTVRRRPLSLCGNILMLRISAWAIGGGVGPVIGGSLAQNGKWYALCFVIDFRQFFSTCIVFF